MAASGEEQQAAVRVIGGWASHYAIRVYVALRLKGVDCHMMDCPASVVLRGVTNGDKDEAAAQVSTALQHLEEAFVKCSQGRSYFGGDNMGFLDIVLGSHLGWLKAAEKIAGVKVLDESKLPELTAWADRFYAHHAVRDVMPETGRLVQFNTYLIGVLKAKASSK
ncbi:hypothetical protein C2845_PM01G19670 [Panicum miliaceum]|uniref:glutathione transferase n=1 Tax=Panicum miliaceum TaxID=4540 RepID=A0A3L6TQU6_PANMI|nr:hypothetical protein C2845_PM01G19670 [Panicum miliaceum]